MNAMKARLLGLCLILGLWPAARGAGNESVKKLDDALQRATAQYEQKYAQAAADLQRAREAIAGERAPLLKEMQRTEDRILTLEREILRLQTDDEKHAQVQRGLKTEQDAARRTLSYLNTLARDGLKAYSEGALPGEGQVFEKQWLELQQALDGARTTQPAAETVEFLRQRIAQASGGYSLPAQAADSKDHTVHQGALIFVGPETFFLPADGGAPGTVRMQAGASIPLYYDLRGWERPELAAVAEGRPNGRLKLDASGGKALRLEETRGSIREHIHSGGVVSYLIIGVGLVALLIIAQKLYDLSRMRLNPATAAEAFLEKLSVGSVVEAEKLLGSLGATTRELFAAGLKVRLMSKTLLEEHLQAQLHRQQMHFERRLPLLAVIATAAPLLGLLGTVTGMVKTFALITVFGTGNAGKLSAGISEVLVATELGLMVAIPALVIHGFLSQRIRKNLSQLDQYAMEFIIAVEKTRSPAVAAPPAAPSKP